jgi:hypothetical protein
MHEWKVKELKNNKGKKKEKREQQRRGRGVPS